ncbi:aminotransferase class III-fold pyridoxal phosphate-dependent enzyme [Paenarthrobacter nicotinovorans]|uniref:Aminotransferase class III-fold pyridoxal phosphate-dependent enzyme n=1 Tax=Paenarthrobacter nicotinovorans TaxID=29320 RepID=A0ABV0GYF5_PAENI|nr:MULTISPECIES: aminotransferase class III-fold pyridoxal phosphate-dependent enzyme [Micrococcaceae]BCW58670.1 aminotransferase [Arthrobacter sp. StoSoilB20]
MTLETATEPAPEAILQESLMDRRVRTIGPHSPLFYATPLEIVAGEGVWVEDAAGKRYLDVYNNVPHVGHSNPDVRDAITNQLQRINLHTRYLNSGVVDYAEKLLSLFDQPLDRVFFTNSGSEANELALRIARQHTGNTGVLISDHSYHGNTTTLAELTTGLHVKEPLGANVRAIRIPDAAGLTAAKRKRVLTEALREVDAAIASLQAEGYGLSAILYDPLFSTEGLLKTPDGYIEAVTDRVHAAGGLVIADEVQSGFGRIGTHMWGHQAFGTTPDLVTLGKPMGNGYPVGGVITTSALLEEFGENNTYFNTFAGSPVSSAAGLAVLRVMEERGLLENAHQLGKYIADELAALAKGNPRIKNVRGSGLFFGLELVNPEDTTPDPVITKALTEELRTRGVLIGKIGRHENVLKMRPPMVFDRENAEYMIEQLRLALETLEGRTA